LKQASGTVIFRKENTMSTLFIEAGTMTAADHYVRLKLNRRSRRFGCGMTIAGGPLQYESRQKPCPLSREEEEYLIFAGVGSTGSNLGDMQYVRRSGHTDGHGTALMSLAGRGVPSACGAQTTRLFYTNDDGVFYVGGSYWQDGAPASRTIQLASERVHIPRTLPFMPSFNQWYTNREGTTYFLPVTHVTELYLNLLLVFFSEEYGCLIVDTDNGKALCGLERFCRSAGGHLHEDPSLGRMMTLRELETRIAMLALQEQPIMCHDMVMMEQALGLGGCMQNLGSGRHVLGAAPELFKGLGFQFGPSGKSPSNPLGLPGVWEGYTPPGATSMEAAVRRVVDMKFGPEGAYRKIAGSPWKDPEMAMGIPRHEERAVEAAIAFADYVFDTYGRFPAHVDAFQAMMACQAHHLDLEFYDQFYPNSSIPSIHREHAERCPSCTPHKEGRS
jgi:hypothetical protein